MWRKHCTNCGHDVRLTHGEMERWENEPCPNCGSELVEEHHVWESWEFPNKIRVRECFYDGDLHRFAVSHGGLLLGMIHPSNIADMITCMEALDRGEDPITHGWEDGNGNPCTLDGWGNE